MRLQSARAALALQLVVLLLVLNLASTKWPRGAWLLFQHGPLALRQRPAESSIPELQLSTERFAYVTLVNNARYVELCSVLAASLHASGAQHPLLVLALPEALRSDTGVDALRLMPGVTVLPIRPLPITPNIKLDQPHWLFAFCKLRIWQLTDYSRLVYIDGDSLVLRNLDYLFTIPLPPGRIAAARDVHACNQTLALVHMMSSLMVLSPSQEIFAGLLAMMPRSRWNNGDQQLIRAYFSRQHGVQLLNETDAAFVHRCRCNYFGAAGRPGTATGPALVHFTTAFAPQWDDNSKLATTRRMEPHGWCRTRAGSVSCTHCADLAYEHWINLRSGLGNTSVPG
jgi:hypothetical protein